MKKLLAVVLSILMLVMPMASFAEGNVWENPARVESTITIHDLNPALVTVLGGDDSVMSAINDLLAALSITNYQQGNEEGFALNLSGKSVLALSVMQNVADDNTVTYASSSLLGGTIAVNSKDMGAIAEKYMRANMKMSGQSDEDIDKAIEAAKEEFGSNNALGVSEELTALTTAMMNLKNLSDEELLAELAQMDTSPLMALVETGAEMQPAEDVTEQPSDCDPAKQYAKTTVPAETTNQVLPALMNMLHSVPSVGAYMDALAAYSGTSWDEIVKTLSEQNIYAGDTVYEVWASEENELVRMAISTTINIGGEEPLPISAVLTRNTVDGVATWLLTVKGAEDTAATLTFVGDFSNFTANLTIYGDDSTTVEFIVKGENVGTDNSVVDVEVKVTDADTTEGFGFVVTTAKTMDGAQGVRKVDVLLRFMGLDVVTITVENRTCDAKDALDVTGAQDLGAMTDEAFQAWYVRVMNQLQNLPMTMMMSLPDSVLTLLMSTGN